MKGQRTKKTKTTMDDLRIVPSPPKEGECYKRGEGETSEVEWYKGEGKKGISI